MRGWGSLCTCKVRILPELALGLAYIKRHHHHHQRRQEVRGCESCVVLIVYHIY